MSPQNVSEATPDRRFLSLFTGAGGLDLGLEEAGWEPLAAVEMDADSIGTLEIRGPGRTLPAHSS